MPRINSLKIRKLGNVAPGTELKFGPRGAVLLGKNGTGKTTLLNILVSIAKCDISSLTDEDYDIEFSMSCVGNVDLHVTAKGEKTEAAPSPEAASDFGANAFRALIQERTHRQTLRIEFFNRESGERALIESNAPGTRHTAQDGEHTSDTTVAISGWGTLIAKTFTGDEPESLWHALQDLWMLENTLQRFDEGLDYFRDLTERRPSSARIEAIQTAKDRQLISFAHTRLISHTCARLLIDDFKKNEDRSTSAFSYSSETNYLQLFCRLADFERARIGADLDEKQLLGGKELITLSPLRFSVERNGSVLHHRHLSFGQRRLLAFLHYHDSTPSLVMADELVNGMHHEWISQCLHLMRDTQAFLSSQNPLLFDFLTFESHEDVASRFVSCDLDEQHRFVWRNMSDSDAREFYETYKAGLQHASEILRTRGYW